MALHGKLLEQLIVLLHLITGVQLVLSAPQPNDPSCNRTCGNVSIPYPFGTSKGCYLDPSFLIICNYSFQPPKPFLGVDHNIDVLNISPDDGELRVSNLVFRRCKLWLEFDNQPSLRRISTLLNLSKFRISIEKNSIFSVGCNFFAYISGSHEQDYKLMSGETVPLVLDWAIKNKTCKDAEKDMPSYLCKAANSCSEANGLGYICKCPDGYQGNAYIPEGQDGSCQDIDECKDSPCNATAICTNTKGSYTCTCPNGYVGDGRNPNGTTGCSRKGQSKIIMTIALGVSTSLGVLFLLIGGYWGSYKVVKKRKMIKRRQKFFKRNGGLLLQQQISQSELNVANMKLFNSKDLVKATDHFNDNRILGQGGQGTVYKGMLEDGRIVAVKKSKITNEGKLQEFINEVIILSQINHRNIVKLLGCCLETEVPLLVYEFVPNGTLSRYLSDDQNEEFPPTWDMRLRIAIEIAGALYYLHSATSLPIYHRDIKSTNILLDDKYRAKVADFGTSRSVAIDQTHLTTLVHGTFGYLDPEYFQSSQFTEKSDVYSFGVVLVELLTGEKAISLTRTPEAKSLATYFICSMEENNLSDILDRRVLKEAIKEELITVANIAKRCLNLDGKKRPTMKEVSMELEAVKISQKASSLEMCKRDDRPTMTEVAVMLDGLGGKEKQTRKEADLNTEESEYLRSTYTPTLSIDVGVGCSSTSTLDSTM
ncbi:hypothetical protein CIPAW_15G025800 [Carya illinoinensis]|uniref:Uncharacterized protein n=2 Tax=Carya illinoinensis TaxID=32201 RepID=A0A8T1N3R9_CARIL|nr:hypothetical protein CIPAW_15G025800 [Carya illinoinensis]